jgi:hypothetical protein
MTAIAVIVTIGDTPEGCPKRSRNEATITVAWRKYEVTRTPALRQAADR